MIQTLPSTLGPYRLLRMLGQGGMSQVYLAVRYGASGFQKQVALKILPFERMDDERLTRALIEEARICAWLQHRNLVQVYDLGVEQGIYYMCMEVVHGVTLATLSKQREISPSLALMLAAEVALALEYVHNATDEEDRPLGLVHRDLSPSNVLLSWAGEVKLSDFGIAKATLLTDATWGRFRKGTIAYMSPEQVAGETLAPQSDQFGLGVILMELLCGRRPFDAESPVDTMERIKEAATPDMSDIPESLRPLLTRMLQRQPHHRFPNSRALYEAIERCRQSFPPATAFALQDALATLKSADEHEEDARTTTIHPEI